jgi:hypothetical protein
MSKLAELAAMAPTPPPPAPTAKRVGKGNIGMIDMARYLTDHGVDFKVVIPKEEDKKHLTFHVLTEGCLFDPNHRGGEAAIVVSPEKPYIFYQCKHQSCKHTWKEAREKISGEEKIFKYYTNHDPSKERRPQMPATELGLVISSATIDYKIDFEGMNPRVPPPHEVSPLEFFEPGAQGKPLSFVQERMAKYLAMLLGPIYHTAGLWCDTRTACTAASQSRSFGTRPRSPCAAAWAR